MRTFIFISVLAVVQVRSYILLTANVEDLQAIAQRIVESPMAGHVSNIVQRATNVFNQHVNNNKYKKDDDRQHGKHFRSEDGRSDDESFSSSINTKNASIFLKSIKKIFENL